MRIFVYGSLMTGCSNHRHMRGAKLLERASVDGFELRDLGAFPAIVPGEGRVHGEVYEVALNHVAKLDEFEGCPRLYRRVSMVASTGYRVNAYVFARATTAPRIDSGDWRKRVAA